MKKFIVESDFWKLFPQAKIGVIVARGINNTIQENNRFAPLLRQSEEKARAYLTESVFSENSVVARWRDAFRKFKTKKGARSSIEALLKRIERGDEIGTINPLVDLYNAISLKHALPCGGEDIDTFEGDLRLTLASGNEPFITLGSEESAPPYPGELVYKDDAGAVCRSWNWRESVRTMLTEDTTNAFLCIELVDQTRWDILQLAIDELAQEVQRHLGGTFHVAILDREHPEIVIEE